MSSRWLVRLGTTVLLIGLGMSTAIAQEVSFSASFNDMAPGAIRTVVETVALEKDATLRELNWLEREGILDSALLEVTICDQKGTCLDADHPAETTLRAGSLTLTLTATITDSAVSGTSGRAMGQLVFEAAEGDGDLPLTGVEIASAVFWAVALVSLGALFVALGRRRSEAAE